MRKGYLLRAVVILALVAGGTIAWLAWPRTAGPVVGTITIPLDPRQPVALAVDAATRRAFVASAGQVYVLDLDSNALIRTVRTGHILANPAIDPTPALLALDMEAGHVFVADYADADGTLSTLDARSGRPLHTSDTIVGAPESIAVDERAGQVFIGGSQSSQIDALDARTGAEMPRSVGIAMNGSPDGLAVDARLHHGFAADQDGGVDMFDTATDRLLHAEGAGHDFMTLAVDARAGRVFAAGDATRNLSVYDARSGSLVTAVPVGAAPLTLAVDEQTGRAFAGNYGDGTVSVVDTRSLSLVRTVAVGPQPLLATDGRRRRVVAVSGTAVSVLDARDGHILQRQVLALAPRALGVDARTGRILVVTGPTVRHPPDPWGWVPRPLRRLPFFAPARPRPVPPRVVVLAL